MRSVGNPAATAEWLVGGGELGELIRAYDWSKTALGPAERWPQSLRSALSICLPSKAQIILCWGPELITLYNDGYRPVFGSKHPHVLGLPVREAWRELWPQGLKEYFEGVLATGEAFWAKDLPFSVERYGYLEEAFFDVSYDPVRDESGKVGGIFCIVNETTGRVVGERRLRTLRDLGTRTANAGSADEIFSSASAVLAENIHDLPFAYFYADGACTAPPHCPSSVWPLAEAAATGAPVVVEKLDAALGAMPGGPWPEPAQCAAVLPIMRAGAGAPYGHLVAGISPRKRLDADYLTFLKLIASQVATAVANVLAYEEERKRAEALAEIDRAKTAFFSNVSHEFRTPLTLMLGPLDDLLTRAGNLNARQQEQLALVRRNAQRLQKLVNSMLDFARIEAGRARASYQPVDLAALTADLASSFRSACERAGLEFRVKCPPLSAPVQVDRDMYEKIVLNLLSNAFKFTLDGTITVELQDAQDRVELIVGDTGIGIPEHEMPRLFERFHRVEGTRGRSFEGTGIGLALVQELVKLHGGSIAVASVEDQGSRFTVSLPYGSDRLPGEPTYEAASPTSTHLKADVYVQEALRWLPHELAATESAIDERSDDYPVRNPGRRLLIVDDNADLREYLRGLFGRHFAVELASNGEEALSAVRAQTPDLVVADVMMPRLDGFGLIRALRADRALCGIPVILLSARAGEESRIEGLDGGADDYLVKPFSARELVARVDGLLSIARIRGEADRRKDEFLAILAHELRGPLAPLSNMLHVAKRADGNETLIRRAHDTMERQLAQLVRIVDDLLDVSRISRDRLELRRQHIELAPVVCQAVEDCRPLAECLRHEISVTLPPHPVYLHADAARLAQVFCNLLTNACKYSLPGGHVAVTAERRGNDVVVKVQDTGIGIPTDKIDSVFELFTQVDSSSQQARSGLGIGLSLVKRLVEMHGGKVTACSEGPGRGSEFVVRLPALEVDYSHTQLATNSPDGERPPTTQRILVVDDDSEQAASLAELLRMAGHATQTAHDGLAAVDAADRFRPDVVLLDIGLPKLDGYAAARKMREQPWGKDLLLVAVTGWGQEKARRDSRAAGFDAHMVKPVDYPALMKFLASRVS
jgi:signal transduction histidine kinase